MRAPRDCPRNIYLMYLLSMLQAFDSPRRASNANAAARQARHSPVTSHRRRPAPAQPDDSVPFPPGSRWSPPTGAGRSLLHRKIDAHDLAHDETISTHASFNWLSLDGETVAMSSMERGRRCSKNAVPVDLLLASIDINAISKRVGHVRVKREMPGDLWTVDLKNFYRTHVIKIW